MSRPTVRTRQLLLDDTMAMKALFGTARNAYERLGFTDAVLPFKTFQKALGWEPMSEVVVDTIADRWRLWRQTFINSEQFHTTFTLPSS